MKKVLVIIIAGIFILLCSCSGTQTDTPSGMKLASVDAADYYMYIPDGWTVDESNGFTSAFVSEYEKSNVSCARDYITNDAVFVIPENREEGKTDGVIYAENYFTGYVSYLESSLPGYKLVSGPTPVALDGNSAVRYRYTASMTGTEYTFDVVICVRDSFAYLLTYTAETSKHETYREAFEDILNTFKFQTGVLS